MMFWGTTPMAEAATSIDLKERIKKEITAVIKNKNINEGAITKLAQWASGRQGGSSPTAAPDVDAAPAQSDQPVASLGGAAPATAKAEDPKSKKIMAGVEWYLRAIQPTEEELSVIRSELSNQLQTLMNEAEQEDQFDVSAFSDTLKSAGIEPQSRLNAITVKVAAYLSRHHGIKLRWRQAGQPAAEEPTDPTVVKAEYVYKLDINNFKTGDVSKDAYRMMWDRWKQKYRGTERQFERDLLELVGFLCKDWF